MYLYYIAINSNMNTLYVIIFQQYIPLLTKNLTIILYKLINFLQAHEKQRVFF